MIAGHASIDDLDAIPVAHGLVWHPIRRRFGIRAFGVNAYTAEQVGGQVVEEHDEDDHQELYVVLRGRATFTLDGEEIGAPAGTFVFVREPSVKRVAISEEEGTTVLALGGKAGEPFRISEWETMFAAIPAAQAERWDEAIALHEDALRETPDSAPLLYNLACMEARGHRSLDALLHLRRAVELDPKFAEYARTDSDFAAIRREPGFAG